MISIGRESLIAPLSHITYYLQPLVNGIPWPSLEYKRGRFNLVKNVAILYGFNAAQFHRCV